jgi:hypothetical protein
LEQVATGALQLCSRLAAVEAEGQSSQAGFQQITTSSSVNLEVPTTLRLLTTVLYLQLEERMVEPLV